MANEQPYERLQLSLLFFLKSVNFSLLFVNCFVPLHRFLKLN